ncbi:hypothetical protein SO802_012972 [Lithocarpus litseifolius]|uniref:Uncharacterized protein n=1 Tax=Lithocarpus litseifolius TaxID=425828 RepID=A0AAW2D507_9ROSI
MQLRIWISTITLRVLFAFFSTSNPSVPNNLDNLVSPSLSEEEVETLACMPSAEEIKDVFSLGSQKAPGPDGPRSERSKSVSAMIGSIGGLFESSRVMAFRKDEIGFGGSGSMVSMFIFRGLEDAPTIESEDWDNGYLSGEGLFCDLL